jgi:hypothetical protein
MQAIVLTYDQQLGLAELVHKSYVDLWPTTLLEFKVPVNGSANGSAIAYFERQPNCRLVRCARPIKSTMRALLLDLADDEWVFWCVDDRYPTRINAEACGRVASALSAIPTTVEQVKLRKRNEQGTGQCVWVGGQPYDVQGMTSPFWGFWHHHFIRVRLLRAIMLHVDLNEDADIDDFQSILIKLASDHFTGLALVPRKNLVDLEEPLINGVLTKNGLESMVKYGCQVPAYPISDVVERYSETF